MPLSSRTFELNIVVTVVWLSWIWWRAKRVSRADPERAAGYHWLASRMTIWLVAVELVFVVLHFAGVPQVSQPSPLRGSVFYKQQVPWVSIVRAAMSVLLFAWLSFWLFLRRGFQTLVEHHRLFSKEFSVDDLRVIWGMAAIACAAGIIVPFVMS